MLSTLMFEVTYSRERHRDAVFVGSGDGFVVVDRAAGLNDGFDAKAGGFVNIIPEREKRV